MHRVDASALFQPAGRECVNTLSVPIPSRIFRLFCGNVLTDFSLRDNTGAAPLDPASFDEADNLVVSSESADQLS